MENPVLNIKYKYDGKEYFLNSFGNSPYLDAQVNVTNISVNVKLFPKAFVELESAKLEFSHKFQDGDRFFSNGYESWSTSREYAKDDIQQGIPKYVGMNPIKYAVGVSSDVFFVPQEREKGHFHSHYYTYIKNVNDSSEIFFLGSLSERSGYTYFCADMINDRLSINKDVEGAVISDEYDLINVCLLRGGFDEVFDKYFELMNVPKPRYDHFAGYTSWYNYFQQINEDIIIRDLNSLDRVKDSVNVFQIDDGYETFVGDWLDPNPKKFPKGLKYIADSIHEKGYKAGIWLAPFSVQIKSRTYKEHPDWIVRHNNIPVVGVYSWGGAYTLDIYNEEARNYIKHFFDVILNEYGFDMVKLDFLYSECMIPRNGKSRGQIECEALDFLRECVGDKIFLGCGVPLGPAFGKIDACRVTCDVSMFYENKLFPIFPLNSELPNKIASINPINSELPSAKNSINNTLFRRQLNGRVWLNDPDVFYLRYSNLSFNMDQKILLGTVNHIFGDVLFVSDNMDEYKDRDIEAVRKFYSKNDEYKVLDVNYVDSNKKLLVTMLDKNNKQVMFWFDVDSGVGNQESIIGLSKKRD